jgi:hypothetical protein
MIFGIKKLSEDRAFGLSMSFILFILFLYFKFIKFADYSYLFILVSFAFLFLVMMDAIVLKFLNKYWQLLGHLMGRAISPLVFLAIFYLVFSPVGILLRCMGRDKLRLKMMTTSSYWIAENKEFNPESFRRQY